ncbi:ABC-2 type transport system permease protein [Streptomyces sp. Ag109_O5-1]|uniref:ABC transporter permease n=1 Tax=Streptomyces sp. Ag109_O5-1 TaxID=1938851 RepID=UPI000F502751|nr:ABC transporter permease [Streptomyces sp. Ag109_O5-1]RPE45660.1 ABC-2 type transport system permease protein [Streptomyces sp. Ag109_O5-1]
MPFRPVLHAEWIKIRTLRSLLGTLSAVLLATVAFSGLAATGSDRTDPLFSVFLGVSFGQIAAVAFGATAVSSDFRGGALRLALSAVPDRRRWFAAKAMAIALPVFAVGLVTGLVTLVLGRLLLGADGPTWAQGMRGALGCGVYLTLMALLAAGLAAVLRSGTATLGVLIPFLLTVSFVIGDMSGSVADVLPDRAGQVVLHTSWDGPLGPWSGLAVTAVWAAAALLAGARSLRRRDA